MKQNKEKVFIKIAAQFTFNRNVISLIAEESVGSFKKGTLIKHVSREKFNNMLKPLRCELKTDIHGKTRAIPFTYEYARKEENKKPA